MMVDGIQTMSRARNVAYDAFKDLKMTEVKVKQNIS
jgi:hypothetical protein